MSVCNYCQETLEGRKGKKYCSSYCRSAEFYQRTKEKEDSLFKTIDIAIKKNRKLLKSYNKAGLATVRKQKLIKEGFNPKFFTHYWKNQKGEVYLFCYEYGFLARKEKYILIQWQEYMN